MKHSRLPLFSFFLLPFMLVSAPCIIAGERRIVFDNPFSFAHPPQPVSSTIELSDDLLPAGTEMALDSLNRYVGLRDVQSGALLPVQWSGLASAGRTRSAIANYVLDLPASSRRELAVVGSGRGVRIDAPAPAVSPIRVRPASSPLSTLGEGAGG